MLRGPFIKKSARFSAVESATPRPDEIAEPASCGTWSFRELCGRGSGTRVRSCRHGGRDAPACAPPSAGSPGAADDRPPMLDPGARARSRRLVSAVTRRWAGPTGASRLVGKAVLAPSPSPRPLACRSRALPRRGSAADLAAQAGPLAVRKCRTPRCVLYFRDTHPAPAAAAGARWLSWPPDEGGGPHPAPRPPHTPTRACLPLMPSSPGAMYGPTSRPGPTRQAKKARRSFERKVWAPYHLRRYSTGHLPE